MNFRESAAVSVFRNENLGLSKILLCSWFVLGLASEVSPAISSRLHLVNIRQNARAIKYCHRLRGGQDVSIATEYQPFIGDPTAIKSGIALGSVEREEITSKLPWPPGAEDKMASFNDFQARYRQTKDELLVCPALVSRRNERPADSPSVNRRWPRSSRAQSSSRYAEPPDALAPCQKCCF